MAQSIFNYSQYNDMNRFANLDSITWKLVYVLLNSDTKYADQLWKVLYYNSVDCLLKPSLTYEQKVSLLDIVDGKEDSKRIFLAPFMNDGWTEECAHLHLFIRDIIPRGTNESIVEVAAETVTHSKVAVILGDATGENTNINPNDLTPDHLQSLVNYKNREEVLSKCVLALFNGLYLDGSGYLQYNRELYSLLGTKQNVYNNRALIGHTHTFGMKMCSSSGSAVFGY